MVGAGDQHSVNVLRLFIEHAPEIRIAWRVGMQLIRPRRLLFIRIDQGDDVFRLATVDVGETLAPRSNSCNI